MIQPSANKEFKYNWPSPLGNIQLAFDALGLTRLVFLSDSTNNSPFSSSPPILDQTISWLEHYFYYAEEPPFEVPLSPKGTPFQKRVWGAVKELKYGSITSYGKISSQLNINSARAVGNAISKNPVALIVPCHRVLMSNGNICGYAWGVHLKLWLLRHEGIHI